MTSIYHNDVKVKNCLFEISNFLYIYIYILKYSFQNNVCIYLAY